MKNLYRRYKISQLLDEPLSNKEKEIVEFILDKINDLTLFIDDKNRHNYMNSKGEWVFQQDEKTDTLWVRYQDFWEVLGDKYSLNTVDIQSIIKGMVETALGTPINIDVVIFNSVETAYKMSVGTPKPTAIPCHQW